MCAMVARRPRPGSGLLLLPGLAIAVALYARGLPRWGLPLAGGTLALVTALLWYTSSLWYFHDFSLPVL